MQKKSAIVLVLAACCCLAACDDSDGQSCTPVCLNESVASICMDGKAQSVHCQKGCLDGACIGGTPQTCLNGSTMCDSATGIPLTCIDNVWVKQEACLSGQKCLNGTCVMQDGSVVNCVEGESICENGVPIKCIANAWVRQNACSVGQSCLNGICIPSGNSSTVCEEGKGTCNNGQPMKCMSNTWVAQPACQAGQSCVDGNCVSDGPQSGLTCHVGSKKCDSDNTPIVCEGGVWVKKDACSEGLSCVYGDCVSLKKERQCTNGSIRCDASQVPEKCENNEWVKQQACPVGQSCKYGSCVAPEVKKDCEENEARCTEDNKPEKCVDGHWVAQTECKSSEYCSKGSCVAKEKCWDKECNADESCVNSVCVPNWELAAPDGTACDTETFVEHCLDGGIAVGCSSQSGIYRGQCAMGCVVADMRELGEEWYPVFCDGPLSKECKGSTEELFYCAAGHKADGTPSDYESSYQCVSIFGGGYYGLDYSEFGFYKFCDFACDEFGEHCSDVPVAAKCDTPDSCTGDVLSYCSDGEIVDENCADYEYVCRAFSSVKYADCFDNSSALDTCSTVDDKKYICDLMNGVSLLTEKTCLHADNDTSSFNYWVKTKVTKCASGCNTAKDGCK